METAKIIKDNAKDKVVVVKCPYCSKNHKHGYGGNESPDHLVRGSDCDRLGLKRDYVLSK